MSGHAWGGRWVGAKFLAHRWAELRALGPPDPHRRLGPIRSLPTLSAGESLLSPIE